MFREDFWEEEEKRLREEAEKAKREGRRPSVQQGDIRPGTGRPKSGASTVGSEKGTGKKKKKKSSVSGSVPSSKGSSASGSGKIKGKKKPSAEQAFAGL